MKEQKIVKNQSIWINKTINFLGYFFIILGFYALIKVSYNNVFLKDNYPLTSVLNINPFSYYQTEEDCYQQYNYPLYNQKGQLREPENHEKKIQQENVKTCINKVRKQREENKINDIWQTIFLFVLGIGIHLTKRFYLK